MLIVALSIMSGVVNHAVTDYFYEQPPFYCRIMRETYDFITGHLIVTIGLNALFIRVDLSDVYALRFTANDFIREPKQVV